MAKGVHVDTWIYSHKGIDRGEIGNEEGDIIPVHAPIVRDKKVKVRIRILKETKETDSPPHATASVKFVAECKELGIEIPGTDIEAIRRAVWSKLDKQYEIKWQPYFLVRVERPYSIRGSGSGVQVTWDTVDKGIAWDGTELLREFNWHRGRHEDIYQISPWPGAFRDKDGRVIACIVASERNLAALNEFAAKLDALRKLMAEFLAPDRIEHTLANLAGVSFLPSPDQTDPNHDEGAGPVIDGDKKG